MAVLTLTDLLQRMNEIIYLNSLSTVAGIRLKFWRQHDSSLTHKEMSQEIWTCIVQNLLHVLPQKACVWGVLHIKSHGRDLREQKSAKSQIQGQHIHTETYNHDLVTWVPTKCVDVIILDPITLTWHFLWWNSLGCTWNIRVKLWVCLGSWGH